MAGYKPSDKFFTDELVRYWKTLHTDAAREECIAFWFAHADLRYQKAAQFVSSTERR